MSRSFVSNDEAADEPACAFASTYSDANELCRILIVDDNPSIHDDFRKILQRDVRESAALEKAASALFGDVSSQIDGPTQTLDERYDLDFAHHGKDGFEKVIAAREEDRPFAMAFVDVRMPPGWDGIETAAKIIDNDPDIQIVICTAFSDYSVDQMIIKIGWTDRLMILKKPYDCAEVRLFALSLTEKWQLVRAGRSLVTSLLQ